MVESVDHYRRTMEGRRLWWVPSDWKLRKCPNSRWSQDICIDYLPKTFSVCIKIGRYDWYQVKQKRNSAKSTTSVLIPNSITKVQSTYRPFKRRYLLASMQRLPLEMVGALPKIKPNIGRLLPLKPVIFFPRNWLKRGVPHSIEYQNHYEKAQIIMNAGRVVRWLSQPTWPVVVPMISLAKVFVNLEDFVIGTERHENRRIDGSFVDVQVVRWPRWITIPKTIWWNVSVRTREGVLWTSQYVWRETTLNRMLTRQVEAAQKRVEGNNYDTRKQVLIWRCRAWTREDYLRTTLWCPHCRSWLGSEIHAMIRRTVDGCRWCTR